MTAFKGSLGEILKELIDSKSFLILFILLEFSDINPNKSTKSDSIKWFLTVFTLKTVYNISSADHPYVGSISVSDFIIPFLFLSVIIDELLGFKSVTIKWEWEAIIIWQPLNFENILYIKLMYWDCHKGCKLISGSSIKTKQLSLINGIKEINVD